MLRISCLCALALLAGSLVGTQAVVPVEKNKLQTPARQLQAKLASSVSVPGFQPNTPLKEALGFLSEKFAITILIDIESFQQDLQIQEPEQQPVKLPAMKDVPLRAVLDLTVKQGQGVLVQRGNILWLVAQVRAKHVALNQRVDFACENMPLVKVLKELSDKTGFNVVLDTKRDPKSGETPISLHLADESLQIIVTLAADLAGLEVVEIGNSLYVTEPANAKKMRSRMEHHCCPPMQSEDLGL